MLDNLRPAVDLRSFKNILADGLPVALPSDADIDVKVEVCRLSKPEQVLGDHSVKPGPVVAPAFFVDRAIIIRLRANRRDRAAVTIRPTAIFDFRGLASHRPLRSPP